MRAGFTTRVIGWGVIGSILFSDLSYAMQGQEQQDSQQRNAPSTPTVRREDSRTPSPTDNNTDSSYSSSQGTDKDSPPRLVVGPSSSAPARLEDPSANSVVVLSDQQQRASSLPFTRRSSRLESPSIMIPIPDNVLVLASGFGNSSGDLSRTPLTFSPSTSPDVSGQGSMKLVNMKRAELPSVKVTIRKDQHLKERLLDPDLDNPLPIFNFKTLLKKARNRSAATSKFLRCFREDIIEGTLTKTQLLAGTAGWMAGVASGAAASAPFMYGLFYLSDHFKGKNPLTTAIVYFINVTQGLDAMSRLGSHAVKAFRPSREDFLLLVDKAHRYARRGAYAIVYAGAAVLAMVPIKYLYEAEYKNIQTVRSEGGDTTRFAVYLYMTAPGYLLNNLLINAYPRVDEKVEEIDRRHYAVQRRKHHRAERQRQEILDFCHDGERLVDILDALRVRQLYHAVYNQRLQRTSKIERDVEDNVWYLKQGAVLTSGEITKLKRKGFLRDKDKEILDEVRAELALRGSVQLTIVDPKTQESRTFHVTGRQLTEEERDACIDEELRQAEALRALLVLKAFHLNNKDTLTLEDLQQDKHNLADRIATSMKALASVGKGYVFFWLIDNALGGGIISNLVAFFGGSLLANGVMGNTEKRRIKEFVFENVLRGKNLHAAKSHPCFRKGTEVFSWLVGAFNTLPFLVLGLEATASWGSGPWAILGKVLMLAPYTIADVFRNLGLIVDPYQGIVSSADSLVSGCCPPPEYMRDTLKGRFREMGQTYRDVRYSVVRDVHGMLQDDVEAPSGQSSSAPVTVIASHSKNVILNEDLKRNDDGDKKDQDRERTLVSHSTWLGAQNDSMQLAYQASSQVVQEDEENQTTCCSKSKASSAQNGNCMAILIVLVSVVLQLLQWVIL